MATIPKVLVKKGLVTKDILAEYGIAVTHFPFIIGGKPKNIATRKYYDEDGDYVFIPETIKYDGIDFSVKFAYKGAFETAGGNIANFMAFISGAEISIYAEHLQIGRQRVRVAEPVEASKFYRTAKKDVIEFEVKFRTEDPMTNISLSV